MRHVIETKHIPNRLSDIKVTLLKEGNELIIALGWICYVPSSILLNTCTALIILTVDRRLCYCDCSCKAGSYEK